MSKLASRARGFTLIDILTAVAIVGILATIAWPAYLSAVRKGNRSAAEAHLSNIAQREQQYLLDQRGFASDLTTLGVVTPATVVPFYTITIVASAGPPPSFTATATPVGSQAADLSGQALTITNTGAKGPSGAW
ncbi:MAG: type IV pilin protein [Betaproteobacteria bacterium]